MKYLALTLPSPEENLACDEALLDACDEGGEGVLRVWEAHRPFVVLGCGNRVMAETRFEVCRRMGVPVLRRCSGGGTVLQGPGCLNYALAMPIVFHPALANITSTNRHVMGALRRTLADQLGLDLEVQGVTDLAIAGRKCAGSAQRRKRRALLFHGCLLLRCDLDLMERLLPLPDRQPDYRRGRPHREFLVNLGVSAQEIIDALRDAWDAREVCEHVPTQRIRDLVESRYGRDDWNLRL